MEDIPLMVEYFLQKYANQTGTSRKKSMHKPCNACFSTLGLEMFAN